MATPEKNDRQHQQQQQQDAAAVRETIATFESMLEVFPEDISALESLLVAYLQIGDDDKLCEKARKLIQLFSTSGDWNRIFDLADMILERMPDDAEALAALEEAKTRTGRVREERSRFVHDEAAAAELTFDLHGELDLAWFLLQHNVITQDQYESAVDRLTESSTSIKTGTPLAFLEELGEIDRVDMIRVVSFLAAEAGMPFIELSRCECQEETVGRIPLALSRRLGILPFDRLGEEIMVAVLNPVGKGLQQRISHFLKSNVHFFFTSPEEYHAACNRYAERQKKE
jgi:tetratricopeptide (TPR) repeat protein